jgi:transcriptional regulator NrdR family protein
MGCPFCIEGKTIVIDSQWDDSHKTIKRLRLCLSCHYNWATYEVDEDQITNLLSDKTTKNPLKDHPTDKKSPLDTKEDLS